MTAIRDAIKGIIGDTVPVLVKGKVTAVDTAKRTIDVEPYDGSAEIYDVRLSALGEDNKGLWVLPKVGSAVVVGMLSDQAACLVMVHEIDTIEGNFGKVRFTIDQESAIDIKIDTNRFTMRVQPNGQCNINSAQNIDFNNGSNGGIVVAQTLINYLNSLVAHIQTLQTAYNTHVHPNVNVPPAVLFPTAPPAVNVTVNNKVRH